MNKAYTFLMNKAYTFLVNKVYTFLVNKAYISVVNKACTFLVSPYIPVSQFILWGSSNMQWISTIAYMLYVCIGDGGGGGGYI